MGKKKSVKKMNRQQSSKSSSRQQQEMVKVEDKQVEKKLKEESKSETECFINELPPEMLIKILKYLNIKSLAKCRLMNRKWNGIAREIIQSRDEVEIKFNCKKTLEKFVKCFEYSKESPLLYTRFSKDNTASVFNDSNWIKFISYFGKSIKCLKLTIDVDESADQVIEFVEKLRSLLLNQLPNLSEFGLRLPRDFTRASSEIQLFPADLTSAPTIQLPHLKVLYLDEFCFIRYKGILTDLLGAAPNLKEITPFYDFRSYTNFESIQLLQSLGKLQCLQSGSFRIESDFTSKINITGKTMDLPFKFKKLNLWLSGMERTEAFLSDAAAFISNILESCRDTLKDLTIVPLGVVPPVQLAKLRKLTKLKVSMGPDASIPVFPLNPGVDLMSNFPVLQDLELAVPWSDFSPHEEHENLNGSSLPNLQSLKITSREMTGKDIIRISQVCPKLMKFVICLDFEGTALFNFPQVGSAIWTLMKQLEHLELSLDMKSPANAFPAVDSCFTGFSREDCERLYELSKVRRSLKKDKIPEAKLEAERQNPSILDLKDLKHLKLHLVRQEEYDYGDYDDSEEESEAEVTVEEGMKENVTLISAEYAFKLMKSLNYKIDNENQY